MSWRLGRVYSQDLRDKIMAVFDAGEPARDVAERFAVNVSYIDFVAWVSTRSQSGHLALIVTES